MQALILLCVKSTDDESPWIELEIHLNRQHVFIASCFLISKRGSGITALFTKHHSIIAPKAHDNY